MKMDLFPQIRSQVADIMDLKYEMIWNLVMRDLFFATHCHTCGGPMNLSENHFGESCTKRCWEIHAHQGCRYGGMEDGCLHCLADYSAIHRPSLANPRHLRDINGTNPMGTGRRIFTKGYLLPFFANIL